VEQGEYQFLSIFVLGQGGVHGDRQLCTSKAREGTERMQQRYNNEHIPHWALLLMIHSFCQISVISFSVTSISAPFPST
jgi:hypothetical protein